MSKRTDPFLYHWTALKQRLIKYGILEYGQRFKLSKWLGVAPFYVHRIFSPLLQHQHGHSQYGFGKQIEIYLETVPFEHVRLSNGLTIHESKAKRAKEKLKRKSKKK